MENKELISFKKVDAHGNVIANKKEKVPLNDDNSKNKNNQSRRSGATSRQLYSVYTLERCTLSGYMVYTFKKCIREITFNPYSKI